MKVSTSPLYRIVYYNGDTVVGATTLAVSTMKEARAVAAQAERLAPACVDGKAWTFARLEACYDVTAR